MADAQFLLKTLNHPHPGIPGGLLGAPDMASLRDAASEGIKDADNITKAAALAFYDARIAAALWVVVPFVRSAPFGRTPMQPIGTP